MNFQMSKIAAAVALTTLGASVTGNSVLAAEAGKLMLEEVVVTAQKRTESVQDIPIAVSAFDENFLKESNVVGVGNLVGYTSGLNGTAQQDAESVFTIRGIGTYAFGVGADNSVGMFIDDVPIGRPTLIGNSFFDLKRVEVVKGPQGTLFGRNASAGAISVITNKPDLEENSLELTAGAGDEGQQVYEVIGNLAVSDTIGVRVAARHDERDGTFENTVNGDELNNRDHTNGRVALRFVPTDSFSADLVYEQVEIDTRVGFKDVNEAFDDKTAQNQQPSQDIDSKRGLMKLTWDINDSMTLTSNTSYMDYDLTAIPVDADVSDLFLIQIREPQEGDQFVQELRLNGGTDSIDWFVGASYIEEDIDSHYTVEYSDFILTQVLLEDFSFCDTSGLTCQEFVSQEQFAGTENTSYAVYGDLAWSINDSFKLTVGARYTRDEKDFTINQPVPDSALSAVLGDAFVKLGTDGPISDDDNWTSFDPRVVLDYTFNEDVMFYGSVSSGYKSGGFNSDPNYDLASGLPQEPASFDEESVVAYELGVKSRFWDGRAQVNAAVYYNDYSDFQVEAGDLIILIENAADVESQGFEIDGSFLLTENFTVIANYSYLDATFENGSIQGVDVSGRNLARAPENSGAIVANYKIPLGGMGDLTLRGDYIYTDEFLFDTVNESLEQDSYSIINGRIAFESANGMWTLAVMGENLGDEEYFVTRSDVLDQNLGIPGMGRLYRAEVTVRF
jgi:iron complex outermembrane receptor protein